MTDSTNSMSELPALLEERHRYEKWLTALDARRASTPQHVFDRVQADYQSRLDRVEEQIEAHRHSIEDERASLESRTSLLKAEEQLRRDERAELESRVERAAHRGGEDRAGAEVAQRREVGLVGHRAAEPAVAATPRPTPLRHPPPR